MRLMIAALTVVVFALGCGKGKEPAAPAAGKAAEGSGTEAPAASAAAPAGTPAAAPAAAQPGAAGAPAEAPKAEAPATADGPAIDKDKLAKAYQDVYCAQKKGEMDKILGIYKANGFNTPAEFTKVWIEAAKDTDWVTKVARDVSKKCP
ncbi:MAG: hypothetical protein FJ087_03295 [Deltaproteobacteria bacterium]|nr:hypothetical protein [Deltaproteobacteria bacterium]